MRKTSLYIFSVMLFSALQSCVKHPAEPGLGSLNINVMIEFSDSVKQYGLSLANAEIKLANLWSNKENAGSTDGTGAARFQDVSAGKYNVSATLTIKKEVFTAATGRLTEEMLDAVFVRARQLCG